MEACNAYYYATRDPLGSRGDFTTAPEISQMFGELIGAALAAAWQAAGAPSDAVYVELGPGRGTLAADALRVLRSAGFTGDAHLVETSPMLRKAQAEAVQGARWHEAIADLPERPWLLVANEFLDALPIRQLAGGKERHVVVAGGGLAFDRDGEIDEESPAREAAAGDVARHLASHGGLALIVDYGHARTAPGDTLQAVRGHRYAPVLDRPGEQDLTSHVDFEAIGRSAVDAGAAVTPLVSQGEWLNRLGIGARAASLVDANPERAAELAAAVQRLTGKNGMGELFKVLAIHCPDWPQPAGFA
ncbi:SAM-dependent methyltransferase [Sphingomonas sp. SE220]|uniref:SAM-dependent methyltransferase n=2 Tax=Sphingomonas hankyongi TaxID=2908209 RepID=A0ABT0S2B6_9SPHN|nr:SAM-dependent methyltransferase [Sphingomonas hankyongi]MCL6729998.1 SAM-dependent methyltransferase [Sphingomonas hankyongi]